jgi:hypothetical protein
MSNLFLGIPHPHIDGKRVPQHIMLGNIDGVSFGAFKWYTTIERTTKSNCSSTSVSCLQLPTSHFRLCSGYAQAMFKLCSGYVQAMFRLCSGYVQAMFRLCSGYVQAMFKLCSGYVQAMFKLCSSYVQASYF